MSVVDLEVRSGSTTLVSSATGVRSKQEALSSVLCSFSRENKIFENFLSEKYISVAVFVCILLHYLYQYYNLLTRSLPCSRYSSNILCKALPG